MNGSTSETITLTRKYWRFQTLSNIPCLLWIRLHDVAGLTDEVGGGSKTSSFVAFRLAGIQKAFVKDFASFGMILLQ